MIERYSVIVPVYAPVHHGFADARRVTLMRSSGNRRRAGGLAMLLVHDGRPWPRSATDAISQLRRPCEDPVANGVLNPTVNVVVGVPCAGVTATRRP